MLQCISLIVTTFTIDKPQWHIEVSGASYLVAIWQSSQNLSVMLECMDPNQFGFIPNSCTTFALISMLHHWLEATDETGSHVWAVLPDYRKNLLVTKLYSLGVKPSIVNWFADFLHGRSQRVKPGSDCFSEFTPVPAGISQGTRIGLWLFLVKINDLTTTNNSLSAMWKFVDNTMVSEIVPIWHK